MEQLMIEREKLITAQFDSRRAKPGPGRESELKADQEAEPGAGDRREGGNLGAGAAPIPATVEESEMPFSFSLSLLLLLMSYINR